MLYYLLRFIFKPLAKKLYKINVEGFENIPTKGGAVLAMNHFDMIDPAFIVFAIKRRIYFLTKGEAFREASTIFLGKIN